MTGPERETLIKLFDLVEGVRRELSEGQRLLHVDLNMAISKLDDRLTVVEHTAVAAEGRALALFETNKKRIDHNANIRAWVAVAATFGGVVAGVAVKLIDLLGH